jgi:hypothetical protein
MTTNIFKTSNRFANLDISDTHVEKKKSHTTTTSGENLFKKNNIKKEIVNNKDSVKKEETVNKKETDNKVPVIFEPYTPISTKFLSAILKKSHEIEEKISENGKPGIITINKKGDMKRGPYTDFEKKLIQRESNMQTPEYVMNHAAEMIGKNRQTYITKYESIHGPDSYEDSMTSSDFYPPNEPIEYYDFSNEEIYDSDTEEIDYFDE